jgi:hypothetical protein
MTPKGEAVNEIARDAKLAPCPFCGMDVTISDSQLGRIVTFVCPDDSPCRGTGLGTVALVASLDKAVSRWNIRAAIRSGESP